MSGSYCPNLFYLKLNLLQLESVSPQRRRTSAQIIIFLNLFQFVEYILFEKIFHLHLV